ncbi:MAG: Clo7bot family Cys-rich peptide [Clostridia bacterium]|nr:Clo7bot family Cys-rich peptide [Clostridia bacterium]
MKYIVKPVKFNQQGYCHCDKCDRCDRCDVCKWYCRTLK